MFTASKFTLHLAIILTAVVTQAMAKEPVFRMEAPKPQRQVSSGGLGSDGVVQGPGQITRTTAVYFDPNPTPFTAFTYSASVQLGPSNSARVLHGEFRFPVFSATPNVSVQIISSFGAAPMQVHAIKIEEIAEISGTSKTRITVEAQTIFDVPANGIYYASLVVVGIPVTPAKDASTRLFR